MATSTLVCGVNKPVHVREYIRVRHGQQERVREHCRGLPRR